MSKEKILPCPFCGKDRAELTENSAQTMTYVWCPNCRMQGPAYFNGNFERVAAISAWNALPRAMRWTKEPPTKPGWYWLKEGNEPPSTVKVWPGQYSGANIFFTFIPQGICRVEELDGEWAGPIPEPKELYDAQ